MCEKCEKAMARFKRLELEADSAFTDYCRIRTNIHGEFIDYKTPPGKLKKVLKGEEG